MKWRISTPAIKPKDSQPSPLPHSLRLKKNLNENLAQIRQHIGDSADIIMKDFRIGTAGELGAALLYTEGLADAAAVRDVLQALMVQLRETDLQTDSLAYPHPLKLIKDHALPSGSVNESVDFDTMITAILSGDSVFLLDGFDHSFIINTKGWERRAVSDSTSQTVVRGPREGFTETLRTNTALIRRRIKHPDLQLENQQIGKYTKTDISLVYIKGIVQDQVVEEVKQRLNRIETDSILESGYVEEWIEDAKFSPFPTVYNTDRPDVVAANLLEGRVAILVDGTPFALLVPVLFTQFFQSAEDYYQRADISSLLRLLRYLAFFISLLGPSFYIAVTTFHQELIPIELLIGLSAQREGVPFPAFVEALFMELTFEILREAGLRMPRAIGQTVSIVGALVLGEAAIQAGLASPAMVIVVSITALSTFVLPSISIAVPNRILRFVFMSLAASFGLFGIAVGLVAMILHLCSLKSFGVPYLSNVGPLLLSEQQDVIFRMPNWFTRQRPAVINQNNRTRKKTKGWSLFAKSTPPKS
ncbi:spore germination protein [Marinicrinis sediminis]|uniref:Spore germination protein n=1 Tax=Marinicrinis sediminis TaxID=1652465 RepID=A0ABW5RF51_9BACL